MYTTGQTKRRTRAAAASLATAKAITATGVVAGSTREPGDAVQARLTLNVTALAADTIAVTVETCHTSGGTFTSIGAFDTLSAVGTNYKLFSGVDRFIRLNVTTLTGTTKTATFSVSGEFV